MNSSTQRAKVRMIAWTALFIAVTLILGLTPLGIIPIIPGFIRLTIMCVPVIVGTLTLGLKPGLALGFIFGMCSLITGLTSDVLATTILTANPGLASIVIFVPRLLIPVASYFVYKILPVKKENVKTAIAACAGSITNTVGFLGLLYLFFSDVVAAELFTWAAALNGSLEAVLAVVICTPIISAVKKTMPKQSIVKERITQ